MIQQSKRRRALRDKGNRTGPTPKRCRKLAFATKERALEELRLMKALNRGHKGIYKCSHSHCKGYWHLTSQSTNPKSKKDDRNA